MQGGGTEINMRRLISLVCTICLLLTVVAPLQVAAAPKDPFDWSNWSVGGEHRIDGDTLLMGQKGSGTNNTILNYTFSDNFTLSFFMKVNNVTSGTCIQVLAGGVRAGFYIYSSGLIKSIDTADSVTASNISDWHEYSLVVDTVEKKQDVYIDGVMLGTISVSTIFDKNKVTFQTTQPGTDVEVADFSIKSNVVGQDDLLTLTDEYTEAFFQDFNEIGGWMVEDERFVTHNAEEGTLSLLTKGNELHVPRSIQRPLRPPANYDMEFRIKFEKPPIDGVLEGVTIIQLSTDNRHSWLYVYPNRILINNNTTLDMVKDAPQEGIVYPVGHDWHVMKAEVRGDNITWYIDGNEFISFKMLKSARNLWHFIIYQDDMNNMGRLTTLDWVKYTPYFEEELKMVSPEGHSDFAEGTNVQLKATPASDVDKVDYYVNGVYVGSGLKKDNYVYTLKDVNIGTYNVTAKLENIETVETVFYVRKAFDAQMKLSKQTIDYGQSVTATVSSTAMNKAVKATKAEYYVNGKLAATSTKAPFKVNLSGLDIGSNAVYAKVTSSAGTVTDTKSQNINVNYANGKNFDINREYMVDYTYKSGSGSLQLNDGYFSLDVKHDGKNFIYETLNGVETYENIGKGDFRFVVTAGHADAYYNNHYLCSFIMPLSDKAAALKQSNISNLQVGSSNVKSTIYHTDWEGKSEFEYNIFPDMTHYSLEFDKKDKSTEEIELNDGMYLTRLSFREDGLYAHNQHTLWGVETNELKLADSFEPGYYRVTVAAGIGQVFRNNEYIASYRAEKKASKHTLKRTMSNPSSSTFVALKNTDDLYYHTDTFEDITEYSYEDYWFMQPQNPKTAAKDKLTMTKKTESNGNHYMSISGAGTYMLNGIAQDAHLKWRGMVDKQKGVFSIVLRRSFVDRQTRLGYDFTKKQWFYETTLPNQTVTVDAVKPDATALQAKKWYDFELVCNGFDNTLYIDGKEVFSYTMDNTKRALSYGRVGFGVSGSASFNFDNFEFIGENRVTGGFMYHMSKRWIGDGPYNFYLGDDGSTVYGTGSAVEAETHDGGRTWENVVTSATAPNRPYARNLVVMPDGTMVKASDRGAKFSSSYISHDNGKTWEGPYRIQPTDRESGIYSTVARLTCTMNGRMFWSSGRGSEHESVEDLYYSDDGINWTKSKTVFKTHPDPATDDEYTVITGIVNNESTAIDAPNGEVWYIMRSNSGFLDYVVSTDGGETFKGPVKHTQLIAPTCCFQIRRDWENPNTYYASFVYDTETSCEPYIQQPRCRTSLAVSYDGMKTWQYVTDVMEGDEYAIIQTSDTSMQILDGRLYLQVSNYENEGAAGVVMAVQDIDKIKPLKRFPEAHYRMHIGFNLKQDIAKDHCVLPKTDGSAWIFGDYHDVKVKDGRADIETMAKAVSADFKKVSNGVEFTLGKTVVKFKNNATSYEINGETVSVEKVILKDGYLDIETLCNIFGKVYRETDSSYCILDKAPATDFYQAQIDNLA